MHNIVAIIPARSGSKSVIDKNIKDLAGSPLIAPSIAAALMSRRISRTIVSEFEVIMHRLPKNLAAKYPSYDH